MSADTQGSATSDTKRFVLGAACAVGTVTIWAGWLVLMRFSVQASTLTVPDLAAIRFAVAGVILLPVVMRRGLALDRLGWIGLLAIAAGGGAAYSLVVSAGLIFAPVSHASALTQGVLPLTIALLAAIVLKEKLASPQRAGLVLIVVGAVAIAGISFSELASRESIGHALFLGATVLWAGYTVALRRSRLDGWHAAAIAAVISLVVYLPLYFLLNGGRVFAAPAGELLFQGVYQGMLTGVASLVLYGRAVTLLGASRAGAFIALGPVIAALLAILFLGEWPALHDWLGIAVVSVGVYLASGAPLPFSPSATSPVRRP